MTTLEHPIEPHPAAGSKAGAAAAAGSASAIGAIDVQRGLAWRPCLVDLPAGRPYHARGLPLPMIGQTLGHYRVLEKIGEGGPPALRMNRAELRRGLAEAATWTQP